MGVGGGDVDDGGELVLHGKSPSDKRVYFSLEAMKYPRKT